MAGFLSKLTGKKLPPLKPSLGKIKADEIDSAGELMKGMAQTVMRLLYLRQHYTHESPSLHPEDFRQAILETINSYQQELSPDMECELSEKAVDLISEQEEMQVEYFEAKDEELKNIIGFITSEINASTSENESFNSKLENGVKDLHGSIELDDIKRIKQAIASSIISFNEKIDEKRISDKRRINELQHQVDMLYSQLEEAQSESRIDELSKLYNRRAFDERMAIEMNLARRLKRPLSLIMLDIDRFKEVNDTLGHQAGDELLIKFSNLLVKEFFRKMDFIARIGGDEFAVIMAQAPLKGSMSAAERMRSKLEKTHLAIAGSEVQVSISVGVAEYVPGETLETLAKRTDDALYEAKDKGRNKVCFALKPVIED